MTTFYVRNWRPNRIMFKYAGLKYIVERRGDRQDTTALPVEAKSDPTVARWLRTGILEEITNDDFISLAGRVEDAPQGRLKNRASDVNIPIEPPNSGTPTVVAKDIFDKAASKEEFMSPHLEWENEPPSTADELASKPKPATTTRKPRAKKTI